MTLNNKQLRCIELMVYTDKLKGEIAEELGVRRETITAWQKRDEFQEALRIEMNRSFSTIATKAKRKLEKLIDSNNQQVALSAAKEVLNKAGYVTVEKIEQEITTHTIEVEIED